MIQNDSFSKGQFFPPIWGVKFVEKLGFPNRPFAKLKFPRSSLPTLLFDDEGVSRGARAPAACSVVLPTIVIARSLRLESGGR